MDLNDDDDALHEIKIVIYHLIDNAALLSSSVE